MSSSNTQKVLQAFSLLSYTPSSLISLQKLHIVLSHLNNPYQYPYSITEELWQQLPTNPYRETTVQEVVNVIIKAQNILVYKIKDLEYDIKELQKELEGIRAESKREIERIEGVRQDIRECQEDKEEYEEDLVLLTRPFGIEIDLKSIEDHSNHHFPSTSSNQIYSQPLQIILWLNFLLLFLQIFSSYSKPQFPNLLVILIFLALFFFNSLNENHLKLSIWTVLISIGLDFAWLVGWAAGYWVVRGTEVAREGGLYEKAVVVVAAVGVVLKMVVVILGVGVGELEDGKVYVVTLPELKIRMAVRTERI